MSKKTLKKVWAIVLAVTLLVSIIPTATASAETNSEKWLTFSELVEEKGYVNGVQQPYFSDASSGNCWGYSYMDGYSSTRWDEESFRKILFNTKAMGFDSLKLWCMYNHAGIMYDSWGVNGDYNVVGIHPEYLENLEKILQMAKEYGLYICLATVNHHEGSRDTNNSFEYENRSKFIWDKDARKAFLNNYIKPIIELTKKYDNVNLIDLFVEPEHEGGISNHPNGTNWDIMREFIKEQNDFIKSINPRLETFCSATIYETLYENYSGLGLDYYGLDFYDTYGSAHDASESYLDKPFIYGEIGPYGSEMSKKDEDYIQNWWLSYFSDAETNGVKAGFAWTYGRGGGGNQSMIDSDGRPRAAAASIHFWALNRDYEIAGEEPILEAPQMAYSTNYEILFFGSRGAEKYRVEKSKDKETWVEITTFDPYENTSYEYAPSCYALSDPNPDIGDINYYRVVALDSDGNSTVSAPSNAWKIKRFECDPSENLVGNYSFEDEDGFNNDGTDGKWYYAPQNGAIMQNDPSEYITDGVPGETTHTGTHSMYRFRILRQDVTLKPNTNYTFTFWIMHPAKQGYWTEFAGLEIDRSAGVTDLKDENSIIPIIQYEDQYKNGNWRRITVFFNSGDHDSCSINFQSWRDYAGNDRNPQNYLDDVYLFESDD